MAEKQMNHKNRTRRLCASSSRRALYGVAAGVIVALGLGICATIIALNDQPVAAVVIGAFDISALVGVFVYGTESRRRERLQKAAVMTGRTAK